MELDPAFAATVDDDFDSVLFGVSRTKFYEVFGGWVEYCCQERQKKRNKVQEWVFDFFKSSFKHSYF